MKAEDLMPTLKGKGKDDRVRTYLTPKRIVWTSGTNVENAEKLLNDTPSQIGLGGAGNCVLKNAGEGTPRAAVLVDFGIEFQGSLRAYTAWQQTDSGNIPKLRIRFGESVSECMAEFGENNTTNDHANRDFELMVNSMSANETNCSGFRFVRVDLIDDNASVGLDALESVFIHRDLDYLGTFKCNDELVNRIWTTAAYTVHLNMQEYLWDGIKRDRLAWIGDMHPEVMTILKVFGANEVVPKSLDYVRDNTQLPGWMNGISAYSMWWILIQYDWFMHTEDNKYLLSQKEYLEGLLKQIMENVDEDGREHLPEWRFMDWPNSENPQGVNAGLQGLVVLSLKRGAYLLHRIDDIENGKCQKMEAGKYNGMEACKDSEMKTGEDSGMNAGKYNDQESSAGKETGSAGQLADACEALYEKAKRHCPDCKMSKQGAALEVWAGIGDAEKINEEVIAPGGAAGFSTFMGYYILTAKAMAGDYEGALNDMRSYWGGMLNMGATTFWEDFDLKWMENAARIDELVPAGKVDIHGAYGNYCYQKFRHSLCHGWSSGALPWMSENILGIKVMEPGCSVIKIEPHLCGLEWVEGTFPTPEGVVKVSHKRLPDGSIESKADAPGGITIVQQ